MKKILSLGVLTLALVLSGCSSNKADKDVVIDTLVSTMNNMNNEKAIEYTATADIKATANLKGDILFDVKGASIYENNTAFMEANIKGFPKDLTNPSSEVITETRRMYLDEKYMYICENEDCKKVEMTGLMQSQDPMSSVRKITRTEVNAMLAIMSNVDYIEDNGNYVIKAQLNLEKIASLLGGSEELSSEDMPSMIKFDMTFPKEAGTDLKLDITVIAKDNGKEIAIGPISMEIKKSDITSITVPDDLKKLEVSTFSELYE